MMEKRSNTETRHLGDNYCADLDHTPIFICSPSNLSLRYLLENISSRLSSSALYSNTIYLNKELACSDG